MHIFVKSYSSLRLPKFIRILLKQLIFWNKNNNIYRLRRLLKTYYQLHNNTFPKRMDAYKLNLSTVHLMNC